MFYRELDTAFPKDISEGNLNIIAIHCLNEILIQIRFNGELDSTYEVSQRGLQGTRHGYVAGQNSLDDGNDSDDFDSHGHSLANYQILTRLGDSNNTKLQVICTQIAEVYQQAILSQNVDGMGLNEAIGSRNFLISLSSKIWKKEADDKDFNKLVYILQSIKEMYI